MRIVVEVENGCVVAVAAESSCEVLVVDRDEFGILSDGTRGTACLWSQLDDSAVKTTVVTGETLSELQPSAASPWLE